MEQAETCDDTKMDFTDCVVLNDKFSAICVLIYGFGNIQEGMFCLLRDLVEMIVTGLDWELCCFRKI